MVFDAINVDVGGEAASRATLVFKATSAFAKQN
jgi:hypothetical protein